MKSIPKSFGAKQTRTQLIGRIAPWCGSTQAQTTLIINTFFEEMRVCLERGQTVEIQGFGVFRVGVRQPQERVMRGKRVDMPEHGYLKFRPSRSMLLAIRPTTMIPSAFDVEASYKARRDEPTIEDDTYEDEDS